MTAALALPNLADVQAERARRDFRLFKKRCWWMPQDLVSGIHTETLGERLTRACADFERGISTFLTVKMPFRHGKSDDASRAFPAFCLGRLARFEPDVLICSYSAELSETFSRKVKQIINSDTYRAVFPDVRIDPNRDAINQWAVDKSTGEVSALGVRGGITGKGGHIIIIDDFFKNREEAESDTIRERTWDGIANNILTRRAPVSIVIICATPWHIDDPFGRIEKAMKADPDFPRFEELIFPAESTTYPTGYLFPERYPPEWYRSQRATLGPYASAGLLDCNPQVRVGGLFDVTKIQFHDSLDEFPAIQYRRGWDLASTEKERTSNDPDYTAGSKVGARWIPERKLELWISDCVYCREEAPERDRLIMKTHEADGAGVPIKIEAVAGYKDSYTTLKQRLYGKAIVHKVGAVRDKVAKLSFLETVFEAGNVHMLRAPWNNFLISQFRTFPNGHDDGPDSVYVAIEDYARQQTTEWDRTAIGF